MSESTKGTRLFALIRTVQDERVRFGADIKRSRARARLLGSLESVPVASSFAALLWMGAALAMCAALALALM